MPSNNNVAQQMSRKDGMALVHWGGAGESDLTSIVAAPEQTMDFRINVVRNWMNGTVAIRHMKDGRMSGAKMLIPRQYGIRRDAARLLVFSAGAAVHVGVISSEKA